MAANLFVIEAPGKTQALHAILEKIGIDAHVVATKGHLYSMPKDLRPLGIDSGLREFKRQLTIPDIGEYIRAKALESRNIYIATDADQEGDVIAWDVAELLSDITSEPYRVRLKGMDEESVKSALDETTIVKKEDAVPGRTRAIIDRMIGSVFSNENAAVGRVSSALLGMVMNTPLTSLKMRLVAPALDGGRPWLAESEVKAPLTADLALKLSKVKFPPLDVDITAPKPYTRSPGHMGEIMVRAGDELDMSPKEAANSLQRLYEAGRMSYPRSGSKGISRSTLKRINAILKKSGYEFSDDKVPEKKPTDVHDSPYPIGSMDVHNDPAKQGFEEGLRTLVGRDLVRSGQSHAVQLGVGAVAGKHLQQLGYSFDVCDFVSKLHWRREVGPRYPGQDSWPTSSLTERRQDTVLLEAAVAHGLGRPSTWASQIEKFMDRKLIDSDFNLTRKGRAWASATPPALLDPRISAYIEDACEKHVSGMMDDPEREPWEILAEKIVSVLPEEIRRPMMEAIENEPLHPKFNPVASYTKTTTIDDILKASQDKGYEYTPYAPSFNDY